MNNIFSFGIDFGTNFSRLAFERDGEQVVLPSVMRNNKIPSSICFISNEKVLIGEVANNFMHRYLKRSVCGVKRLIGRTVDDPEIHKDKSLYPFDIDGDDYRNVIVNINLGGVIKKCSQEQITSYILKHMSDNVENYIGLKKERTKYAVLAVPSCFNDYQRRSIIKASELAGINVLGLVNDTAAAAVACLYQSLKDDGIDEKEIEKNVLVYDFGGGSFDVSIIHINNNEINVIATSGDDHLGGEDITNNLMKYVVNKIDEDMEVDLSVKHMYRIKKACEEAKIALSEFDDTNIDCGIIEGKEISYSITRNNLLDINRDIFDRTVKIMNETFNSSNISKDSIDEIILLGGSSKIPAVVEFLKNEFSKASFNQSVHSDEAVAIGASILASSLCRNAIEKQFENGLFALVDKSNNNSIITIINDILPPPSSLNAIHRYKVKSVTATKKLVSEDLFKLPTSDEKVLKSVAPPQPPPPPPHLLHENEVIFQLPSVDSKKSNIIPEASDGPDKPIPSINNPEPIPDNPNPIVMNKSHLIPEASEGPDKPIPSINNPEPIPDNPNPIVMNKYQFSVINKRNNELMYFNINDVITHNIYLTNGDEKNDLGLMKIAPKNRIIPCEIEGNVYITSEDNQTELELKYCECDSDDIDECKRIKTIRITNLPEGRIGEIVFVDSFRIDKSGLISIIVEEENNQFETIVTTMN